MPATWPSIWPATSARFRALASSGKSSRRRWCGPARGVRPQAENSELLARGPEQDLVDVHVLRLADGEGHGPCEGIGGNRVGCVVLVEALGNIRLADGVGEFRELGA